MSEIKPTPGPWEAKPTGPWDGWDGWSVEDATGAVVCDAHGSQLDGRREANARLIAAAPELLEALIELADEVADRFDLDSPSTNPSIKHAVSSARAAIAKATEGLCATDERTQHSWS